MATTALGTQLTELHFRQQISLRARLLQALLRLWPSLDTSTVPAVSATWPAFEQGLVPLVQLSHSVSAGVAARYYDTFRAAEGISGVGHAVVADALPEEQIITSIRTTGLYEARRQLGLQSADVANQTLSRLMGSTSRLVAAGGRDTVEGSVAADRQSVGWARMIHSKRPCAFCLMLVSRGPVYKSSESATQKRSGGAYHDHCSCGAEPVFDKNAEWPGGAKQIRDLYDRATEGFSGKDALNAFRRAVERG